MRTERPNRRTGICRVCTILRTMALDNPKNSAVCAVFRKAGATERIF